MNAVRFAGDSYIGAIIDQNFRSVRIRDTQNLPGQLGQIARAEVAFADLYEVNAFRDPVLDMSHPFGSVPGKISVGDEAANHNAV